MPYLFLLSICFLGLISCTTKSQTYSTISNNITSTHGYAVPEFENKETFDQMEKAFPVIHQLFILKGENRTVEVYFTLNPQREALVQWLALRLLDS